MSEECRGKLFTLLARLSKSQSKRCFAGCRQVRRVPGASVWPGVKELWLSQPSPPFTALSSISPPPPPPLTLHTHTLPAPASRLCLGGQRAERRLQQHFLTYSYTASARRFLRAVCATRYRVDAIWNVSLLEGQLLVGSVVKWRSFVWCFVLSLPPVSFLRSLFLSLISLQAIPVSLSSPQFFLPSFPPSSRPGPPSITHSSLSFCLSFFQFQQWTCRNWQVPLFTPQYSYRPDYITQGMLMATARTWGSLCLWNPNTVTD